MENELRKQFKIDRPETVGETEIAFDNINYIEWLEKKYLEEQLKQPVKTLEEVGLSYNENNGLGVVFGKDLDYIKLHKWTPDQLRAIANHIEQTNKTPTK